ncbi:hypothetical protein BDZ89DRAFT_1068828 [Hymenopellis radicata]|nr:hypothetical protein BDZ89DRAFT_1068828 [Hymenopellis radicata]
MTVYEGKKSVYAIPSASKFIAVSTSPRQPASVVASALFITATISLGLKPPFDALQRDVSFAGSTLTEQVPSYLTTNDVVPFARGTTVDDESHDVVAHALLSNTLLSH